MVKLEIDDELCAKCGEKQFATSLNKAGEEELLKLIKTEFSRGLIMVDLIDRDSHPQPLKFLEVNFWKGTLLHRAAEYNCYKTIKMLLHHGIDINFKCSKDWLHIASYNSETIAILLKHGADLAITDRAGKQPLHHAAATSVASVTDCIKCLVKYGAEINKTEDMEGRTPLFIATELALVDNVRTLLDLGADVNIPNKVKTSPIHVAVKSNNQTLVEILLGHNMDFEQSDTKRRKIEQLNPRITQRVNLNARDHHYRTALCYAAKNGSISIMKLLLDAGADAARGGPIHLAAEYGSLESMRLLIDHGANPDCRDNVMSRRPIHEAAGNIGNRDTIAKIEYLLEFGVDIDTVDHYGFAPIHFAKSRDILTLLLEVGAKANIPPPDSGHRRPILHHAIQIKAYRAIELLLAQGVSTNSNSRDENSPLHIAISEGEPSIVKMLLNHGANVEQVDKLGQRPIHVAITKSFEIVRLLIDAGADIEARTRAGETPFSIACKAGDIHFNVPAQMIGIQMIKNDIAAGHGLEKFKRNFEECFRYSYKNFPLDLPTYVKKLEQEIASMKDTQLSRSPISLYDILVAKDLKYRSIKTLVNNLRTLNYKSFPEYGEMLRRKI